jgi:two-component system sensor histidine kinase/response regulator
MAAVNPRRRWTDAPDLPPVRPAPAAPGGAVRTRWARFVIAAVVAVAGVGVLVVVVGMRLLGGATADLAEELGQGLVTLAAAITCGLLARRSIGKRRPAWLLIAAAALITFITETGITLGYELATGGPAPFPSAADAFYLVGQVLLIAGVLAFPAAPTSGSSRSRVTVEGGVIAVSLLYVSWAVGLGSLYSNSLAPIIAKSVALAYPISDIVIVTVLILTIRRVQRSRSARLELLLAGLVVKSIADGALAVLSANAGRHVDTGWANIIWIAGYALIALAALWPTRPHATSAEDAPTSLWEMMLPWLGLVAVIMTSLGLQITGHTLDSFLIYPGVALVLLLMASQVLSYKDSLGFLNRSRQAEAALKDRTNLLNQIIAHAPLGVARVNTEGRFIDANPRLGSLMHAPMKVLLGARVDEFLTIGDAVERARLYESLSAGQTDTIEEDGEVRRADGSPAWLHWTTTAVRKSDGSFEYYLSMVEDITSRHEAEETAMANLAGLERLNQLKSEFVSMVSHEFRTALVGIQGFSELIRDDDLEASDVKGLAGDINNDAMRLNRMIGEMLDLDRMEAGKIRLNLKPIDMNSLLKDAVARTQVSTDSHTIVEDLDPLLPPVSGDSDRLIQVISNLLSNAMKYSPAGGEIKVTSRLDNDGVHVAVQDHGLGIPAEFITRLFGRYERFESNHAGKVAGTGLGLAITRQIVELHSGKIWAESTVGSGSTFNFTVPIAVANDERAPHLVSTGAAAA